MAVRIFIWQPLFVRIKLSVLFNTLLLNLKSFEELINRTNILFKFLHKAFQIFFASFENIVKF